jgi:hypothetical protein
MSSVYYLWRVLLTSGPQSGQYTSFFSPTTPTVGPNGETIDPTATVQLNVSTNLIYQQLPNLSNGRSKTESVLTSPSGANLSLYPTIAPNKSLNVLTPSGNLFNDSFLKNNLNTIDLWSSYTNGNSSITQVIGLLSLNASITNSSYGYIVSKPNFIINGTALKFFQISLQLESSITSNNKRYWGVGIPSSTFSYATPYSNGFFFKIENSQLYAICISNSVEVYSQLLTIRTDNLYHNYYIQFKDCCVFWYVDNMELYLATTDLAPFILNFYLNLGTFNDSSGTITASTFNINLINYDDTSVSVSQLSDVSYPWRKTTINKKNELVITNNKVKFRDGFADTSRPIPDTFLWDISSNASNIITNGGNSSGSSYLLISMSPFLQNIETVLTSKSFFDFPFKIGCGFSMSQRLIGQEVGIEVVGYDEVLDTVPTTTIVSPFSVTATQSGTTITVTTTGVVPITGGTRVILYGFSDSRLNTGPFPISINAQNSFQITNSPVNVTISTPVSGTVAVADQLNSVRNGFNLLIENATVTNGSICSRRNGSSVKYLSAQTISTTNGTQTNGNPYTDSWNTASNQEFYTNLDELYFRSYPSDSLNAITNSTKFSQAIPDEDYKYKLRIRTKNLQNFMIPVGRINSVTKSGTSTATVVTDVAHNLNTTSFVYIYGIRDLTPFPNLTASTQVLSIVNSTTFTITIGSASTSSSNGGAVFLINGGVGNNQILTQSVQSISSTVSGVLTVIGNTGWTGPSIGEYMHLYGLTNALAYEGAYKVLQLSGSSLLLATTLPTFGSITTGGCVIRRTDVRIHYIRFMDYTRLQTEIIGGRGNTTDNNNAIPVTMASGNVVISSGTINTVSTVSTMTSGNLAIPGIINDVGSAAIIITTTTSTLTPTFGVSYVVNIIVTLVSGSNPTMDVDVQESDDSGTSWYTVYSFARITLVGAYRTPKLFFRGNRIRYVQTIGGATPSFTRSINRLQCSDSVPTVVSQLIDRTTINVNTLNSTTPSFITVNCSNLYLGIRIVSASVAPAIQLQASEDNGVNWYNVGTVLTSVPGSVVYNTLTFINFPLVRAIVTAAGTTAVLDYVIIRTF